MESLQKCSAPSETCFAPVQAHFAPVRGILHSLGGLAKHLLRPLLTTFGNSPLLRCARHLDCKKRCLTYRGGVSLAFAFAMSKRAP